MKQVESYFKDYPANKQCYTTSDGMVFHSKYDAQLHAKSLQDDEVVEHKAVKQVKEEVKEPRKPKEPKEPKEPKDPKNEGAGSQGTGAEGTTGSETVK